MEHLEIELKFFLPHPGDLRKRLHACNAQCRRRRTFEYNVRYDTADDRLLKNNCLLRLRKDRSTTLTVKAPPTTTDDRFKILRELEVGVEDFDAMDAILKALGFFRRQSYEKWRETWRYRGASVCLDSMPFGSFLEIEGNPDQITTIADDLGLQWERRILHSYLGIFERLRDQAALAFNDITFDNFRAVQLQFDTYRRLFEAGPAGND